MKRIKKRLSLTLRPSQTVDESLSELAEQMTVEEGGTKDSGKDPPPGVEHHDPDRSRRGGNSPALICSDLPVDGREWAYEREPVCVPVHWTSGGSE